MLRKSTGNMYPWVTHTHSHLGGECPHKCVYCYVDNPRFGRPERYTGELRLIEKEFEVKYGASKIIFMENCNDLFAEEVPELFIKLITNHCLEWPDNDWVWQTKNPIRYLKRFDLMPLNSIFGCTIETNRDIPEISKAPSPWKRYSAMCCSPMLKAKKFITIEPILDFDVDVMLAWLIHIEPDFVNIGADSKGHGLPEPPLWKVEALIENLQARGIEVREKQNLERLKS